MTVGLLSFSNNYLGWTPLPIGGGGFISGVDIANDGTRVVRTDTYGAYIFNVGAAKWQQLLTKTSMPSTDNGHGTGQGVYEIAIAPSNSAYLYMIYNGYVFASTNQGQSWTRTGLAQDTSADPNDSYRGFGRKISIDPANPLNVVVSTPTAGVSYSSDGGSTWNTIPSSSIAAAGAQGYLAKHDPSTSSGGSTPGLYVSSYGQGVYHTSAGPSGTWTKLSSTGMPTTHQAMDVGPDGAVYFLDNAGDQNALTYISGAWASHSVGSGGGTPTGIAADPATAGRAVAVDSDGNISIATGHTSWSGKGTHTISTPAGQPAWHANTPSSTESMFGGGIKFDPSLSNTLLYGWGLGTALCNPATGALMWTDNTAGVEQMVTNRVICPPGSVPLVACWDRAVFRIGNLTSYPSSQGTTNDSGGLSAGWSIDYAAGASFVACLAVSTTLSNETSGYSTDGGQTWTQFSSKSYNPNLAAGGWIAVASSTNMVVVTADEGSFTNKPYVTSDGGNTWTAISLTGVPTTPTTGWSPGYPDWTQCAAADRVDPHTLYLYNNGGGTGNTGGGVWKSTDSANLTWTKVSSNNFGGSIATTASMQAVPGQSGHLFGTAGKASGGTFQRSTDHGSTWQNVANVTEVWAFGFGAIANGQSYPSIYIAGFVSGVWGIWRSVDNCSSWQALGDGYPLESLDVITTMSGDMSNYGVVYVGFLGSGAARGYFP